MERKTGEISLILNQVASLQLTKLDMSEPYLAINLLPSIHVSFRTYAGKTLTALFGQMDFKRYLYSRG